MLIMRRVYISVVMMLFASILPISNLKAQNLDFGGTVLNNDIVTWMDLYDLSFTSNSFGTARSMAMGNAFTALGADMVSASLNPAGVGMYVVGDTSFTPMISVAKSNTSGDSFYLPWATQTFDNRATNFAIPNMGVVVPVSMSAGLFTNINFATSYNRIADFNQTRLMASRGHNKNNSLANYLCLFGDAASGNLYYNESGVLDYGDPYYWGVVLADQCGLMQRDDAGWHNDKIDQDAIVDQYSVLETLGAVDEWSFSGGFNLVDKVYLGIAIGLQSLDYTRNIYCGEGYRYENGVSGLDNPLIYTNYMQSTHYFGTGYNFKFGVTARPVHWLRIGVAYHTPTYYNLEIYYAGEMWTETANHAAANNGRETPNSYAITPNLEEYGIDSWEYRTPSRLLMGVAATIGKRAIISVDYERGWYQGIRLQRATIQDAEQLYNSYIEECFKGNGTLRLGVEWYMLPMLALRAGYTWSDSAIKDIYQDAMTSRPLPTKQTFLSAGFGWHLNKTTYLDFAYQYGTTHYTAIQPFYVTDDYATPLIESAIFDTKTSRHNFVMTLGFRF